MRLTTPLFTAKTPPSAQQPKLAAVQFAGFKDLFKRTPRVEQGFHAFAEQLNSQLREAPAYTFKSSVEDLSSVQMLYPVRIPYRRTIYVGIAARPNNYSAQSVRNLRNGELQEIQIQQPGEKEGIFQRLTISYDLAWDKTGMDLKNRPVAISYRNEKDQSHRIDLHELSAYDAALANPETAALLALAELIETEIQKTRS